MTIFGGNMSSKRNMTADEYIGRLHGIDSFSVEVDAETIRRSLNNPLETLATLAGLTAEEAAEVSSLDVDIVTGVGIVGRRDRIERGIARLALAYLCRLRGEMRTAATGGKCKVLNGLDDPRGAVDSFAFELSINNQLRRMGNGIDSDCGTA